ncbi:MAG: hypothetical protein M1831_002009 [Alyxoria varia]|nr:MAG: hypothetical protein M1831_002009 [Alyxoria varia]
MKIPSLLNPEPSNQSSYHSSTSHTRCTHAGTSQSVAHRADKKKLKMKEPKDAPKFVRGEPKGEVAFPPHQPQDQETIQEHEKFEIFPKEEPIRSFPREIPYNSDKKDFQGKTGRDAFQGKDHSNCSHSWALKGKAVPDQAGCGTDQPLPPQTEPAKAIGQNPGLKDLCFSITGGALVAQGYWVPYEAAKAIAALFCWEIRYALSPVFGPAFPTICVRPDKRVPSFYNVSPDIIGLCEKDMNLWTKKSPTRSRKGSGKARTPKARRASSPTPVIAQPKELRPRTFKKYTLDNDSQSDATHEDSPERSPLLRRSSESRSHEIQRRKSNHQDGKENMSSKSDFKALQHMKSKSLPEASKAKRMCSNGSLHAEGVRAGGEPGNKDKRVKAKNDQNHPTHRNERDEAASAMVRLSRAGSSASTALNNYDKDEIDAASALIDLSRGDRRHYR